MGPLYTRIRQDRIQGKQGRLHQELRAQAKRLGFRVSGVGALGFRVPRSGKFGKYWDRSAFGESVGPSSAKLATSHFQHQAQPCFKDTQRFRGVRADSALSGFSSNPTTPKPLQEVLGFRLGSVPREVAELKLATFSPGARSYRQVCPQTGGGGGFGTKLVIYET